MAQDVLWIFKRSKFESTTNPDKHDAWLPELFTFSLEEKKINLNEALCTSILYMAQSLKIMLQKHFK
ncbi:hypothetical protein YC2023_040884 [Brassica napus]